MAEETIKQWKVKRAEPPAKVEFMKWVRPFLAVVGMGGITAGFFVRLIDPQAYLAIVAMTVTWWFKSRDQAKGQ
jgi:hypothetical protein